MGYEEKQKKERDRRLTQHRKTIPYRIIKAIIAFFVTLPLLPILGAMAAYKTNRNIWKDLDI